MLTLIQLMIGRDSRAKEDGRAICLLWHHEFIVVGCHVQGCWCIRVVLNRDALMAQLIWVEQ